MNEERPSLSRMEIYSGSFVIFVGIFFLLTSIGPLFQNREAVPFSATELSFMKSMVFGLLNVSGGILLFLFRKPGWILSTASLLAIALFPLIVIFGSFPIVISKESLLPLLFVVLAVMAFLFMFNRTVRRNQRVTNKDYLLTFSGYLVFFAIYYWL